jgi:hypothetical protein
MAAGFFGVLDTHKSFGESQHHLLPLAAAHRMPMN